MPEKTIAGYTTTYNCFEMQYPFVESIRSLLGFCDQVVVVDAGSKDGTIEALEKLARQESRLKVSVEPVDFSHPRWAIYQDGYLKAKARAHCQTEYCWQSDTDEIVAPEDYWRIRQLPLRMGATQLIMLPMIEFWGSLDTVRGDFLSWKPRLSVNDKRITHGIPKEYRCTDAQGHEYPRPFDSDSCNYIYGDTLESVQIVVPMKPEQGSYTKLSDAQFEAFYFRAIAEYPPVYHASWLDLPRKILHYKKLWRAFHASMYNLELKDDTASNVMFSKPWSEVSDEDIQAKARELKILGPRFFMSKANPFVRGLSFKFTKPVPEELKRWAISNATEIAEDRARVVKLSTTLPLVSVVVTSHEQGHLLQETLKSVAAQDYCELEIVVVNNGSTDKTSEIAQSFDRGSRVVRIVQKAFAGFADARNFGVQHSRGDFVMTLAAGDKVLPGGVSVLVNGILQQSAGVSLAAAALKYEGQSVTLRPVPFDRRTIRQQQSFMGFALYSKAIWEEAGGFKDTFGWADDWCLWVNAARANLTVANSAELVVEEQLHSVIERIVAETPQKVWPLVCIVNADLYSFSDVLRAHEMICVEPFENIENLNLWRKITPQNWLVPFLMGLLYEKQGDKDKAVQSFVETIQLTAEKNWQAIYRTALILKARGNAREAEDLMRHAVMLRPDCA